MLRLAFALLAVAGCAEGMSNAGSPDLGGPHDGAAGSTGVGGQGGEVRACDAAVETLNGLATYIAGSVSVVDPAALAPGYGDLTCQQWLEGSSADAALAGRFQVTDGTMFGRIITIASTMPTAAGCDYRLELDFPGGSMTFPCETLRDYVLTVP